MPLTYVWLAAVRFVTNVFFFVESPFFYQDLFVYMLRITSSYQPSRDRTWRSNGIRDMVMFIEIYGYVHRKADHYSQPE